MIFLCSLALDADIIGTGHSVFLNRRDHVAISEEWAVNFDGTITNVGANLCLDGLNGDLTVGTSLQLNDCANSEKGILQEQ
mgnify:FL=1